MLTEALQVTASPPVAVWAGCGCGCGSWRWALSCTTTPLRSACLLSYKARSAAAYNASALGMPGPLQLHHSTPKLAVTTPASVPAGTTRIASASSSTCSWPATTRRAAPVSSATVSQSHPNTSTPRARRASALVAITLLRAVRPKEDIAGISACGPASCLASPPATEPGRWPRIPRHMPCAIQVQAASGELRMADGGWRHDRRSCCLAWLTPRLPCSSIAQRPAAPTP